MIEDIAPAMVATGRVINGNLVGEPTPLGVEAVLKATVRDILKEGLTAAGRGVAQGWSIQGLGMLRKRLSPEVRLHVWDSRYRVPEVTMLHDHPWDFTSYVVAGWVEQYRYEVARSQPMDWFGYDAYMEGTIICGEGGGECAPPQLVYLKRGEKEIIPAGCSYDELAEEVHESLPEDGTVTLIFRRFKEDTETAHVYRQPDAEWVSAEPRQASAHEVGDILRGSLGAFFR